MNIINKNDKKSFTDYFSTYVTYTQPLPGGTTLSATGTYSFNSAAAGDERYISQSPNVSFTLSQSLRPFWTQGTIKDPTILSAKQQSEYYRLQLLKTSRVLQKQNSAPTLNLTLQPAWTLETVKNTEWKDAWNNSENPSWSAIVSVNLSPLLNAAVSRNEEKYEISYEQAEKSYENYLRQKQYVLEQYQALIQNYLEQLENVTKLYEEGKAELEDYRKQYEAGAISRLDFDSVKIRVENCGLSKNCVEIYKWMYEILYKIN